jgi:hypothetical protein
LQLASYLENLELSLYTGGCEGITDVQWIAAGFPTTFQQDICAIAEVSSGHMSTISMADQYSNNRIKQATSRRHSMRMASLLLKHANMPSHTTLPWPLFFSQIRLHPSVSGTIWGA